MGGLLEASPDRDTAFSGLYELGSLFERHGTGSDSASWYAKFAAWAGWRADADAPGADVPPGLRLRVVYAVVGMARAAMREISGPRDERLRPLIEAAIRSTREAEELCRERRRGRRRNRP